MFLLFFSVCRGKDNQLAGTKPSMLFYAQEMAGLLEWALTQQKGRLCILHFQ